MPATFTPTGWTSPDLGQAYFAVEAAITATSQPSGSGISEALRRALAAIEKADCELEKVALS